MFFLNNCLYFSAMHIWRTFNALFIIRSITKYLIETCSEFQLLQHFEANPVEEDVKEVIDLFVVSCRFILKSTYF